MLISIIAFWITIYTSPKEIPVLYIIIAIIGIVILGIIIILLNKFSSIDEQPKSLKNIKDKTESLNNIRLDIKELQREVFNE